MTGSIPPPHRTTPQTLNDQSHGAPSPLDALSERERRVVIASRIHGLSQRQIAAEKGVSQSMVKKICDRAENKLRSLLSASGVIN